MLPNASRRKGKQTMKFGHFTEYNRRNIFIEKSYSKCGEASPWPFSQKINIEHISGSIVWNVIKFVFIVCPSQGLYQNILKLRC